MKHGKLLKTYGSWVVKLYTPEGYEILIPLNSSSYSDSLIDGNYVYFEDKIIGYDEDSLTPILSANIIFNCGKYADGEYIKKYFDGGGKCFTIKLIDTIRDGGTKLIDTTKGKYYIDKDTKKLHSNYPTHKSNLMDDILLETYLIDRIKSYLKRSEENLVANKILLIQLENGI